MNHSEGCEITFDSPRPPSNLFKELDEDGDGQVTFDELTEVVRKKLRKGPGKISENALKALWCALDVDCSNAIQKDEMAAVRTLDLS